MTALAFLSAAAAFYFLGSTVLFADDGKPIVFNDPIGPLPDPDLYVTEYLRNLGSGTLNYQQQAELQQVDITGSRVIIKNGYVGNHVYRFDQSRSIKIFRVYADTVIISSPFRLPQTDVEIYARELRFEDSADSIAYIDTTPAAPKEHSDRPAQFAQGEDGVAAGKITIMAHVINVLPSGATATVSIQDSAPAKRFIARGGAGQPGGLGQDGPDQPAVPPLPTITISGKLWIKPLNPNLGGCFPSQAESYRDQIVQHTIYYHAAGLSQDDEQGDRDGWPLDGNDAKPGGRPGKGGEGGNFHSNMDVTTFVDVSGGQAGANAGYYKNGKPGSPAESYKIYCLPGNQAVVEHDADWGRDAYSPCATHNAPCGADPPGSAGGINIDAKAVTGSNSSYGWLSARLVEPTLRMADDLYLSRYYKEAREIYGLYSPFLADATSGVGSQCNVSSTDDLADVCRLADRFKQMSRQLSLGLDFFGEPPNWAPLLSFELYKTAFDSEIGRTVPLYFLSSWLGGDIENAEDQVAALKENAFDLQIDIDKDLDGIDNLQQKQLPSVQSSLQDIEVQQESFVAAAKIREEALHVEAENDVAEKKRKEEERSALRIVSLYLSLVPVAQPYMGLAGTTLNDAVDGDNFWTTVKDLGQSYVSLSKYETDISNFRDAFDNLDFKSPQAFENSYKQNSQKLQAGLGDVRDKVDAELKWIADHRVPDNAVDAELDQLKQSDRDYTELLKQLDDLKKQKEDTFQHLVDLRNQLLDTLNTVAQKETALEASLRESLVLQPAIDLRTKALLTDLRRTQEQRLRRYYWFFAKSYEYLLLRPFHQSLVLPSLYEKQFEAIEKAYHDSLTQEQISSMIEPYRLSLSDVTEDILGDFENDTLAQHHTLVRFVEITQEEIDALNHLDSLNLHQWVPINLASRKEFMGTTDVDRRLVSISVSSLSVPTDIKAGSLDIDLRRSDQSLLNDGTNNYIFSQLSEPTWTSVYDIKSGQITSSEPADEQNSLVYSLLSDDDKKADKQTLFANPALDGTLWLQEVPHGDGLSINSLTLKVTYSYSSF